MADEKRAVPYAKGKALADEYKIRFFETSAKDNINVEEVRVLGWGLGRVVIGETLWWCGRVGTRKAAATGRRRGSQVRASACGPRTAALVHTAVERHMTLVHASRGAGVLSAGQGRICRHGDH